MKFLEIFRFEFLYQLRRFTTPLFFIVLAALAFLFVRGNYLADALYADFYINSPFVIASVTVFCSLFWFLGAAAVSGEAGARDMGTGLHPLLYTAPISKAEYLGGRFLAAFGLNAVILLGVPVGVLLSVYVPGVDAEAIGPFRAAAYLTAYGFIALPNAFVGTAVQFAWAVLGRRAIASYIGSVVLFFVSYGGIIILGIFVGRQDLSMLLDVFAHVFITSDLILNWTPIEKSRRLIELEGPLLRSRLFWLGVAVVVLAFTYLRFRFAHPVGGSWWTRLGRRVGAQAPSPADVVTAPIAVPQVPRTFGFATWLPQTGTLLWASFRAVARSRGGLLVAAATAFLVVVFVPLNMADNMSVPLLPTTGHVLTFLTTPLTNPFTPWIIIPLFLVIYAGELVWREREAGLGEITDAAPVPEWSLFLGRFGGLLLFLFTWMMILAVAGVLVQLRMDYHQHDFGLFLKVLLGLQLPEWALFALLALVVHTVVNHKYLGHLVALLVYAFLVFSSYIGVEHNLLVYGDGPGWSYNDMRGFAGSVGPWLWFRLYWAAWALLLAVVARLFWVRGKDYGWRVRLGLARPRFTRSTAVVGAVATGLILVLGGYIYYNTNILHDFRSAKVHKQWSADYERRYAPYRDALHPLLAGTRLHVEIYPKQEKVDIRGTYQLVNSHAVAIDSIHLSTMTGVETGDITFDRPATRVLADDDLGYRIYKLERPLPPGDSLELSFTVRVVRRGFTNSGASHAVVANGTYFTNEYWLPQVGYQYTRELDKPGERRAHGLPARAVIPTLEGSGDVTGEGIRNREGATRIRFEAVVGTDAGQVAIAPGVLRRAWNRGGRRYFHYATETPIGGEQAFFSARYAVKEGRWKNPENPGQEVAIQIYYHPEHTANLDRIYRSVYASLDYHSREFGPYPHPYIRVVENPVRKSGAHADASSIDYGQLFSLFNPEHDPRDFDLTFAVIAHEMAHQWWGGQLPYAYAEGAGLLTESPAWYSAMGVVEETHGKEHVQRLLRFFRQPHPIPPIRPSVPLLRGADPYAAYRKGPFALYALSEYMGKERVNSAYRRMIEKYGTGKPPLPTSLDLYRELKAVTPDTLLYLLHDLFAANTFWELKTKKATAKQAAGGSWQVTLQLDVRKVVVNPAGAETEVPMDEWIPVGVFASTGEGAEFGKTLYLQKHRIRTGEQTITVAVPARPADAGIDPYHLLIDLERFDNVERVVIEQ